MQWSNLAVAVSDCKFIQHPIPAILYANLHGTGLPARRLDWPKLICQFSSSEWMDGWINDWNWLVIRATLFG